MTGVSQPERSPGGLDRVVVVGASLAGLRTCETLRTRGFSGAVTLIGAERHLPYDRPPLSKKLLAGEWEPERIALRKPEDLAALRLDMRLGTRAVGLDLATRAVALADGSDVPFDGLVIATGSRPRRLPGQGAGVYELRTLDDALALRSAFAGGSARVVVIGAGFIGLEVAATARGHGCRVTVLEGAPAPLIRGLGAQMGTAAAAHHGDDGTIVRCSVTVTAVHPDGVELAGGEVVPAEVVVVGVGVAPNTAWLEGSGLELRDGVVCDETLCAGVAGVYAAGDVARWPNPLFTEEMRVEHWTNAAEQGAIAADNLLSVAAGGTPSAYAPVPFVWSDQGRHRLQFLGRAGPADDVRVVVGAPAERAFLALYGRAGRLRGALGVNLPRLVMPYRRLLVDEVSWDEALEFAAAQQTAHKS
ncbi:MAG: FAD-dependent oxidoreductase [Actinomycetota bacterium]|nr:FAD-dependent oxidoreductase [Actinomycetota bacterium]